MNKKRRLEQTKKGSNRNKTEQVIKTAPEIKKINKTDRKAYKAVKNSKNVDVYIEGNVRKKSIKYNNKKRVFSNLDCDLVPELPTEKMKTDREKGKRRRQKKKSKS